MRTEIRDDRTVEIYNERTCGCKVSLRARGCDNGLQWELCNMHLEAPRMLAALKGLVEHVEGSIVEGERGWKEYTAACLAIMAAEGTGAQNLEQASNILIEAQKKHCAGDLLGTQADISLVQRELNEAQVKLDIERKNA